MWCQDVYAVQRAYRSVRRMLVKNCRLALEILCELELPQLLWQLERQLQLQRRLPMTATRAVLLPSMLLSYHDWELQGVLEC